MSVLGVGVDLVENARIQHSLDRFGERFLHRIFTAGEIEYCQSMKFPARHFAARFAAKEAFLKATGFGLMLGHELAEIEVVNDENGKPLLILQGKFKTKAIQNNWNKIHLSISHLQSIACAVVIIEQ